MSTLKSRVLNIIRGNLGVIVLSSGIWNFAGQMTWGFFSLYVLELGGSYVDVGYISALGSIIMVIPTFIGGYLADTLGRKRIIYLTSFLLTFTDLIRGVSPNHYYLYIAATLGSIFQGLMDPSLQSIIIDSTNSDNRALGYAFWTVVPPLFGVFSPYIIGQFMDKYGVVDSMRWAYFLVFGLGLVSSLLRLKYLEETLVTTGKPSVSIKESLSELLAVFVSTLKTLSRQLWIFIIIDGLFTFAWGLGGPYFVNYATEVVKLTGAEWGLVMMTWTVVNTIIRLPFARLSDKYGRLKFMFPAMFLWGISFLLFIYTRDFKQVLIIRGLVALSSGIGDPAWQALFGDYTPKEHRGRVNAIKSISFSLTWGFGNIIGGYLYQNFSKVSPFLLGSGIQLFFGLASLLYIREPKKRQE